MVGSLVVPGTRLPRVAAARLMDLDLMRGDPRLQRGGLQGDDGDRALPAGEPLMPGSLVSCWGVEAVDG